MDSPIIKQLVRECEINHVALIDEEAVNLLALLIQSGGYKRILEIGTGLGYSTIYFAQEAGKRGGEVVTIERMPERAARAREYFQMLDIPNITQMTGDALDILPHLEGSFDLIFMDAAMGQYLEFFHQLYPRLAPGGLLAADNIYFKNLVFLDRYQIPRRRRTMQERLRAFLDLINHHPELTTRIFSLGDGLAVSYRHRENEV